MITNTVGDVLEFWRDWCDKQNVAEHYGNNTVEAGESLIIDDAEYWADKGMSRLLDAAIDASA